jgi:hypothetical protein
VDLITDVLTASDGLDRTVAQAGCTIGEIEGVLTRSAAWRREMKALAEGLK